MFFSVDVLATELNVNVNMVKLTDWPKYVLLGLNIKHL